MIYDYKNFKSKKRFNLKDNGVDIIILTLFYYSITHNLYRNFNSNPIMRMVIYPIRDFTFLLFYHTRFFLFLKILKLFNKFGKHNIVLPDYYMNQLHVFMNVTYKKNKWYIGNFFGLNLFTLFEIPALFCIMFIETLLIFLSLDNDYCGIYNLLYRSNRKTARVRVIDYHSRNFMENHSIGNEYNNFAFGLYYKSIDPRLNYRYRWRDNFTIPQSLLRINYHLNNSYVNIENKDVLIVMNDDGRIKMGYIIRTHDKDIMDYPIATYKDSVIFLDELYQFSNDDLFEKTGIYFK